MKKYLSIWMPALAVLLVVSCGGKSTKTLDEAAENADSVMVESQQEPEPPVVKVKGELGLFDLQGPVKSCTLKNQWGKVSRTFNEQGLWQTYNGKPLSKVYPNGIERDEQGRIVKGKMDSAGNGDEYEYNDSPYKGSEESDPFLLLPARPFLRLSGFAASVFLLSGLILKICQLVCRSIL